MLKCSSSIVGTIAIVFAGIAVPATALIPPPSFEQCRLEVQTNLQLKKWCRCPTVDCTPLQGTCTYVFQTINGVTWHGCACAGETSELCRGWARNIAWDEDDFFCTNACPSTHDCNENLAPPSYPTWAPACDCVVPPPI